MAGRERIGLASRVDHAHVSSRCVGTLPADPGLDHEVDRQHRQEDGEPSAKGRQDPGPPGDAREEGEAEPNCCPATHDTDREH